MRRKSVCTKHNLVSSRSRVVAKPRYRTSKHDQTPNMMWLPKNSNFSVADSAVRTKCWVLKGEIKPITENAECAVEYCPASLQARSSCDPPMVLDRRTWGEKYAHGTRTSIEPGRLSKVAHGSLEKSLSWPQATTEECNMVRVVERVGQSRVVAGEHSQK
jgi:hypothetical protein